MRRRMKALEADAPATGSGRETVYARLFGLDPVNGKLDPTPTRTACYFCHDVVVCDPRWLRDHTAAWLCGDCATAYNRQSTLDTPAVCCTFQWLTRPSRGSSKGVALRRNVNIARFPTWRDLCPASPNRRPKRT